MGKFKIGDIVKAKVFICPAIRKDTVLKVVSVEETIGFTWLGFNIPNADNLSIYRGNPNWDSSCFTLVNKNYLAIKPINSPEEI